MPTRKLLTIAAAFALAVAACGGSASSAAPGSTSTAGATKDGGAVPTVDIPAAGGGSCKVEVTGDVTKSWESKQTQGTLLLSQWLSDKSRKVLSLADNEEAMLLNCGSGKSSVNFTTAAGTTSAQFKAGPGSYVIAAGGMLGGGSAPGEIGLLFNADDSKVWGAEEPGTFTVTTFGGGKFIGTFSVKVVTSFDTGTTHSHATITGSFDLGCTGDACN
jgi:hypothetical protein